MKNIFKVLGALFLLSFNSLHQDENKEKQEINTTLDSWHIAAATANYNAYFDLMTPDAVFIGTDATENWNRKDFEVFAKPRFDSHNAWTMKAVERNVFLDPTGKVAWFDELLKTRFKICRGSGVLVKIGKKWKIKHYVLSLTIPDDVTDEIVKIKTPIEDTILQKLEKQ